MKKCQIRNIAIVLLFGSLLFFPYSTALSHCQIPCGIYDDALRVEQMLEDSSTIFKAMNSLVQLQDKNDPQSANQRVRWIMNKEKHAQHIIKIISNYFLTQRVKPGQKDYVDRLKKHHAVIVAAMKVKQSASVHTVNVLKAAIEALKPFYPADTH